MASNGDRPRPRPRRRKRIERDVEDENEIISLSSVSSIERISQTAYDNPVFTSDNDDMEVFKSPTRRTPPTRDRQRRKGKSGRYVEEDSDVSESEIRVISVELGLI